MRESPFPRLIFGVTSAMTLLLLLAIFLFLLFHAVESMRDIGVLTFLMGSDWNPVSFHRPSWGMGALLMGTLMVVVGSLLLAVPVGIGVAIYLSQLASPMVREVGKPIVEMIASIPSVALGIVGLLYVAPLVTKIFGLSSGLNAVTAFLLVSIVVVPSVASLCEDALSELPRQLRDASLALGATPWMTISKVLLPAARSGIVAAVMLGLGRAIGETVIVLMVAGNSLAVPQSLLDPIRPVTSTIAIEIKEAVVGSLHWSSLFFLGLLLFVFTFVINIAADIFFRRRTP